MLDVRIEPLTYRAAPAAEWRAREGAWDASPYLSWDWLMAWIDTYGVTDCWHVRIGDPPIALGLLERRGRRLRFAGGPVTPVRGLLCPLERREAAWGALGAFLRRHGGWSSASFAGVPWEARLLPRARVASEPTWLATLPESFDWYLAERSFSQRKSLRRRLRRIEDAGGTIEQATGSALRPALDAFVSLHGRVAAARGERHPQIDDRLAAMLALLPTDGPLALRVFVLRLEGATAAVTVRLDRDDSRRVAGYNGGWDPAHHRLGPGVALELASIRDAIERGNRRYDLGPGDLPYKRELGAQPVARVDGEAFAPGPGGALLGAAVPLARGAWRAAPGRSVLAGVRRRRARVRRAG